MKEDLVFKKTDGTLIPDPLAYVTEWINRHPFCTVTIGCDSQEHSKFIKYSIVVCLHDVDESGIGHGAHVISVTIEDKTRNIKSDLYTKLWQEAELALQVAELLKDCGKAIKVHLDFNSDEKAYSNVLYNAGVGYVKASGFECEGKPTAWASTHMADKLCR